MNVVGAVGLADPCIWVPLVAGVAVAAECASTLVGIDHNRAFEETASLCGAVPYHPGCVGNMTNTLSSVVWSRAVRVRKDKAVWNRLGVDRKHENADQQTHQWIARNYPRRKRMCSHAEGSTMRGDWLMCGF